MAGFFGQLARGLRQVEGKAVDASALTWNALLGNQQTGSGVSVNLTNALKVSTVLAGLRVLSNGIAQVPLKCYRIGDDDSRTVAADLRVHRLLWRRPNDWMTSFEWRQMAMMHAVFEGVHVSYVGRIGKDPAELIPLIPGTFELKQATDWTITCEMQQPTGGYRTLDREEMFILRGPSWMGPGGLRLIEMAREAIGLAIATEQTHAALHANGAQPGGILSFKGRLNDADRAKVRTAWEAYQGGLRNRFKTAVLDNEAKWEQMQMKGVDAQHLETRRFQIEEVCRELGIFPQMVGYTDKTATFASAEAFFLAHVVHSLQPWVENWEQAIARDLLPRNDDSIVAKFSMQGLLRGDNKTRAEFYTAGIINGWLTRNEARKFEELNPLKGLDDPLVPLNMGTQTERDALAKEVGDAVKSMIGHNGGPALNDEQIEKLERKVGRVLSAANERRIVSARDNLTEVLDKLGDN